MKKTVSDVLLCGAKWLNSQQVYCQLPINHTGMHHSEYYSDSGEEGELWYESEATGLGDLDRDNGDGDKAP